MSSSDDSSKWIFGVALNISGSVLINLGTNLMKLGHLRSLKRKRRVALADAINQRQEDTEALEGLVVYKCCQESWTWIPSQHQCRFRSALLSKTWFIGFLMFFIGNVMNFVSFQYAAQSLLAALGSVQFVTNVVFARFVLHEKLTCRVLIGTLVLICGVALVVEYSCHGNPAIQYSLSQLIALFVDTGYLIYLSILLAMLLLAQGILVQHRKQDTSPLDGSVVRRSKVEAISYATISAIPGAQSVTFFKILSELLGIVTSVSANDDVSKRAVYHSPFSYLICFAALFTSLFWVHRLNEALRLYDILFIIPVLQVMWVTLGVVGGGIFFHEFEQCFHEYNVYMFVLGLATIFFGVFLISPQPEGLDEEHETPLLESEPFARHDSLYSSGSGLGMTLPHPSLVKQATLRSIAQEHPPSSDAEEGDESVE